MNKLYYLFVFFTINLSAQRMEVSGTVGTIERVSLTSMNIVVKNIEDKDEVLFIRTDDKGYYKVALNQGDKYEFNLSLVGYHSEKEIIQVGDKPLVKDFVLLPSDEDLQEIVIKYDYSGMAVRNDSVLYDVSKFTDGTERKLRDQLAKLPGVEVSDTGTVKVNGRLVTKFLVEGNTFFNGGTRLGVEYIPSDAVEQVQVIDNYSEIKHMKSVSSSDVLAMNIKLKEGKNKFVFGELKAAIGNDAHYQFRAPLFYYSTKLTLNVISDINDFGASVLSLDDIIRMDGFESLYKRSKTNSLLNLKTYLADKKNTSTVENQFISTDIRYSPSEKVILKGMILYNKNKLTRYNTIRTEYLTLSENNFENRNEDYQESEPLLTGRLSIGYEPNSTSTFRYNIQIGTNWYKDYSVMTNQTMLTQSVFDNYTRKNSTMTSQLLEYFKSYSNEHRTALTLEYNTKEEAPVKEWNSNKPFLVGIVPWDNALDKFSIYQHLKVKQQNFSSSYKYFYTPLAKHHFYVTLGVDYNHNNTDISITSGENLLNKAKYELVNPYLELEYKMKMKKWENITSVRVSSYNTMFRDNLNDHSTNLWKLEPRFSSKYTFYKQNYVQFKYSYEPVYPKVYQLLNTPIIKSFNSVYSGDMYLDYSNYHSIGLNYFYHRGIHKFSYNGSINYISQGNAIIDNVISKDYVQHYSSVNSNKIFSRLNVTGVLSYQFRKVEPSVYLTYGDSKYHQLINEAMLATKNRTYSVSGFIRTRFTEMPNFDISYTKRFNETHSLNTQKFNNDELKIKLDYKLNKQWVFKTDYRLTLNSYGQEKTTQELNAILEYIPLESSWRFELIGNNLLNSKWKQTTYSTDIMVIESINSMFPRVVLLGVTYKL